MIPPMEIAGRQIGPGQPAYIIAELSANHGHDFEKACELVRTAKRVGADAVKLQTYTPDTITIDCDNEHFRIRGGTLWDSRILHDLYAEAYMPWEWQPKLMALASDLGLACFSSPFDFTAVDFLESCSVPAYKIASFELVDIPLIRRVAATGKPLIISTGMASLDEIREAVQAAEGAGGLALLKCTSGYPALPGEMNLRTIPHLAETFSLPIGLSDHTIDSVAAIAAVSLGACIVEKHIALSRADGGPDSAFSLEPDEFARMVADIRTAEAAMGAPNYEIGAKEASSRAFRRSLFVVQDIKAGETFTAENVRSIRPSSGLHTRHLEEVFQRKAAQDIKRGTPLSWEIIAS